MWVQDPSQWRLIWYRIWTDHTADYGDKTDNPETNDIGLVHVSVSDKDHM